MSKNSIYSSPDYLALLANIVKMCRFSHLHVHTQFSLLDGQASIKSLYQKAMKDNMPAIAITDHGNMFGAFEFVSEAYKHKNDDGSLKVKPIIGCEFYVVEDRTRKSFTKDQKDNRYHQVMAEQQVADTITGNTANNGEQCFTIKGLHLHFFPQKNAAYRIINSEGNQI